MLYRKLRIFGIFIQIPKYILPNITLLWLISSNFVILTSVRNPEQLMYKALYEKGLSKKHPITTHYASTKHTRILMIIMKRALETPYHSRILMIIMKRALETPYHSRILMIIMKQ